MRRERTGRLGYEPTEDTCLACMKSPDQSTGLKGKKTHRELWLIPELLFLVVSVLQKPNISWHVLWWWSMSDCLPYPKIYSLSLLWTLYLEALFTFPKHLGAMYVFLWNNVYQLLKNYLSVYCSSPALKLLEGKRLHLYSIVTYRKKDAPREAISIWTAYFEQNISFQPVIYAWNSIINNWYMYQT